MLRPGRGEGSAITVFRSEPIDREKANNPNNRNQGSIASRV